VRGGSARRAIPRRLALAALLLALGAAPARAGGVDDAARALDLAPVAAADLPGDFRVLAPDGGPRRLADLPGRVLFLNFWATWCEPCREEMPAMERLFHAYRDRGLALLAVSADREGAPVVRSFLRRHGLTFPVGLDPEQAIARRYRVFALPSTFVVDRQGGRAFVARGPREWDGAAARAFFDALLR
jgi:peroxiredoxin